MRQFVTIASNAFMELVRQPIFLLLMTTSVVFEIFLATPYYFAFGDEPKLVKNSTLAVMLLAGLVGSGAQRLGFTGARDSHRHRPGGALQAGRAHPVPAGQVCRAGARLGVLTYVNLLGVLLASRMAFDAYGSTDLFAVGVFLLARGAGLSAGRLQQLLSAPPLCLRRGFQPGADGDAWPLWSSVSTTKKASPRPLPPGWIGG